MTFKGLMANIEKRISSVTERVEGISQVVEQNSKDILLTNHSVDALEQYARRNNLRIFGLEETQSEDVDGMVLRLINEKLNININNEGIERTHRIGKKTATYMRPVIIKFVCVSFSHKEVFERLENIYPRKPYQVSTSTTKQGCSNLWQG